MHLLCPFLHRRLFSFRTTKHSPLLPSPTSTAMQSPARSTASDRQDPIFPTPSTSPWSSPKAFPSSPWDRHPSHSTVVKRCGKILSLGLSHSGAIYAGTESKSVRVWKAPGFAEFTHLTSGSPIVAALLVSPDGKLVFTAHSDHKIRVWNTVPVHVRKGTLPSFKDNLIETWVNHPRSIFTRSSTTRPSSSTGSPGNRLKHSGPITSLAYDPSTCLVYSASVDNSIKVWDVQEMKCVETIYAHDDAVNAVAVGPDKLLFSGSEDTTVKVWSRGFENVNSSSSSPCHHGLLFYLQQQRSPVKAIIVSGEGREYVLYAGCADGCLYYWIKGKAFGHMSYLGFMRGHGAPVTCLAESGGVVASGSAEGTVRVWQRSEKGARVRHQCAAVLSGHMGPVTGVAVALDGEKSCMVYGGSLDGSVKQWWVPSEVILGERGRDGGNGGVEDGGGESDYFEISGPLKGLIEC